MRTRLSPLGTARARFAAARGERQEGWHQPGDAPTRREVESLVAYLAWELLRSAGPMDEADGRAAFLLLLAVLVNEEEGSTRLETSSPGARALFADVGATPAEVSRIAALVAAGRPPLLGPPSGRTPLVVGGGVVSSQRMNALEGALAREVAPRLSSAFVTEAARRALDDVVRRAPRLRGVPASLSPEQEQAVLTAAHAKLTVVVGGPGTGKTFVVASLLRLLVRLDVPPESVALAAPTGKAANRLTAAVAASLAAVGDPAPADELLLASPPPAQTLHRLLGYSPEADSFVHHANNPLHARVVVVDEGSMVDLTMALRLLRALRDDAKLILLGDSEQLPSVEAGTVFRDLAAVAPGCRLTRSYRTESAGGEGVAALAERLRAGGDVDGAVVRSSPSEIAFAGVERLPEGDFLEAWFSRCVAAPGNFERAARKVYGAHPGGVVDAEDAADLDALLAHHETSRILTVTRARADGANERLHRLFLDAFRLAADARDPLFYPGEPVAQLRNDYARELFNGDQGVVVRAGAPGATHHRFAVAFRRGAGLALHPLEALRDDLVLGYASTVHKAQGSEFDRVAFVLPDEDMRILTRELVYTAVTRSRRAVLLVGSPAVLSSALARRVVRTSGFADSLAAWAMSASRSSSSSR